MAIQIERRLIKNFDWGLFSVVMLLNLIGILNLSSAGINVWKTQLIWLLFGLLALGVMVVIDYQRWQSLSIWVYGFSILLLVLVLFFGVEVRNSKSWFNFGPFRFQPSELSKLGFVMFFARLFHRKKGREGYEWGELVFHGATVLLPAFLIMLEPDMGTTLIFLLVGISLILFIGVKRRVLVILAIIGGLSIYPGWKFVLKPHQRVRIISFVHPEQDPLGSGYNLLQSKIAIGSGGWKGKGFREGTQNMLRFLPEQHTDFPISVWAEEWGFFLGIVPVFVLFLLFFSRCMNIALEAKDKFGLMLVLGSLMVIFWHTIVNIAMSAGLFPVIGVPLPFFSYGGSHLITVMALVGLILNVRMRKYVF